MKTIFILCDTMNRRMLDLYNNDRNQTALMPNLNRLAKRGGCSKIIGAEALPACRPVRI